MQLTLGDSGQLIKVASTSAGPKTWAIDGILHDQSPGTYKPATIKDEIHLNKTPYRRHLSLGRADFVMAGRARPMACPDREGCADHVLQKAVHCPVGLPVERALVLFLGGQLVERKAKIYPLSEEHARYLVSLCDN